MAKATPREQLWVWLDDPAFGPLQQIGTLSEGDRGSVSFAYEPDWLAHVHAFQLDPELDNHGFMRSPAGWRLAPAYDMNPSFKKEEHALALDIENRLPDLSVVLNTAGYYRLDRKRARAIIEKVAGIVSDWEHRARNHGLSRQDCLEAAHIFRAWT